MAASALFGGRSDLATPDTSALTRAPSPSESRVESAAEGASAASAGDQVAHQGASPRNSSSSLRSETLQGFKWTPFKILWAGGTLLALIVLAASPGVWDRWRSR